MFKSECEENHFTFCQMCMLFLYCVLSCTSAKISTCTKLKFHFTISTLKNFGLTWWWSNLPAARGTVSHSGRTSLASGGEFGCHAEH